MRMNRRWAATAVLASACVAMGSCTTATNPFSFTQSFIWIATAGDQILRPFTIQLLSGAIEQVGDGVSTGSHPGALPLAMTVTPNGQTVILSNGDNTVDTYTVNSDGSLTPQTPITSIGQLPVAIAVDPTGNFLFAADQGSGDVSSYKISSGSLSPIGQVLLPTPAGAPQASPSALAVAPTGNFLYVTDRVNNTLLGFSYDSAGNITPLPGPQNTQPNPCGLQPSVFCVPVGANPDGLAFSRCAGINPATPTTTCANSDDNNLFVSNAGSNSVSIFTACIQASASCSTPNLGTLTELPTGSPVAACCGPSQILIDPVADFVYVLEAGASQLGEFSYSPVTGALTTLSPASVSTGSAPFAAGITANTSNTNWVVVTNANSSNASVFAISGGRLTGLASGPILLPSQPTAVAVR